jgi:hypothetical protein
MEEPKFRYNIPEIMGSWAVYGVQKYHSSNTEYTDVSKRYKVGLKYGLKINFLVLSTV